MMEKLDVFLFVFVLERLLFTIFIIECKKLRLVSATTFIGFNTAKNEPSNAETFTAKNV